MISGIVISIFLKLFLDLSLEVSVLDSKPKGSCEWTLEIEIVGKDSEARAISYFSLPPTFQLTF